MAEKELFIETLKDAALMALATDGEAGPNVRIMDFIFDPDTKTLSFPTHGRSAKTAEIAHNGTVALTTIPMGPGPLVRVQGAKAEKSAKTIDDLRDALIAKRAGVAHLIDAWGDGAVVYDVHITGGVVIDKGRPAKVEL